MSILTASEVFEFAVKVEENGERFYRSFADRFQEPIQRELFNFLAKEESRHRKTFEKLSEEIQQKTAVTSYPDEYTSYLQAYADSLIFTDTSLKKELERIKNVKEACEFGIRRELDSILYYQEIKNFVPEQERDRIDSIIAEERRHFIKLTEMKRELQ
jgi:rubrerythrin